MLTAEIQRAMHSNRLSESPGAQAEIPVMIVAIVTKPTEFAKQFAVNKKIAARDGKVVGDERKTVRVSTKKTTLPLQRWRGRSQFVSLVGLRSLDDRRDQRKAPLDTGVGNFLHQGRNAVRCVVVIGI